MSNKSFLFVVICLLTLPLGAQPLPLAQYTFNSGTAVDDTGNGFDGILLDSAAVVNDAERGLVMQLNQGSMRMDGPFPITTSFTLSVWIKVQLPPSGRNFFEGPSFHIRTDRQDNPDKRDWIDFRYPDSTSVDKWNPKSVENPLGFLDGQWHHYIFVLHSSGDNYVYFDGVLLPRRDNAVKAHDFGGAVGPILAGGDGIDGCMDDIRLFNYVVPEEEFDQLMAESPPELARNPVPKDGATDVVRTVTLTWEPGNVAATQDVYIGTEFADVNEASRLDDRGVLASRGQTGSSYTPPNLKLGDTNYWRIDSVEVDGTIHKGRIWSFTTEPVGYPIDGANITATASSTGPGDFGPEKTVDGSGLDANDLHSVEATDMWLSGDEPLGAWIQYEFNKVYKLHQMWVWNSNQAIESVLGLGLKDVTIEYSTNGTDWAALPDVPEFARAPAARAYAHDTTVDFGGAVAKYVRLTANSNWGGLLNQYSLSEVRFLYIPLRAREPSPDSGATDVDVDVTLGWRAGREAAKHNVYISTDEQAVMDGTADVTTVTEPRHGPLSLDLAQTYYWKVNEVNEAETPAMLNGNVLNFVTRQFLVVDDFESYNDLEPTDPDSRRIFNVWKDGYEQPTNGSLVGYENAPFCEQTIVHGGKQSMPLFYNNTGGAAYSEAELTLSPSQDWTKHGVKTLSLWFFGDASNTAAQMYVKVNGTKVAYDGNTGNLVLPSWQVWNIDLASVGTNLQNVTTLSIGIDGSSATGKLYFDDFLLYRSTPETMIPSGAI